MRRRANKLKREAPMTEIRPCKFGCGLECAASDRGRADCYVCGSVRAALSSYSRLARDNMHLLARIRELEAALAKKVREANGEAI
jgi:hypothetical protein